jgi:hypothetical protein
VVVDTTVAVVWGAVLGGGAVLVTATVVVAAMVDVAAVLAVADAELEVDVVVWAARRLSAGTGATAPTRVTET